MPTKINKPSPFTAVPVGQIMAAWKPSAQAGLEAFNDPTLAGYKKKNIVTKGLAGLYTGNKALAENLFGIDPVSFISSTIAGREYKPGVHTGGEEYGVTSREPEQLTYSTNIDPMTGEENYSKNRYEDPSPLPMTGKPLKMLTGVNSPMTYKMSAAQYKSAVKMSEISGASTLPSALTLKGDQYKIDANKDGEITGEDFKLLKNK